MSMTTKILEKKVAELDKRVAELSLESVTWQQRARISEKEEHRLDKALRMQSAFRLEAEQSLRAYREASIFRLVWNRLRGRA